ALAIFEELPSDDDSAASDNSDTNDEDYVENVAQGENISSDDEEIDEIQCPSISQPEVKWGLEETNLHYLSHFYIRYPAANQRAPLMSLEFSSCRHDDGTSLGSKRHLDAFIRGRIIGKFEEGRSVTSVTAEFGIADSIVSRLWRQFQTTGTAIRGFSSGRP
ncbi:transposable element Tcb1 transposase, partial [Trichonephila clavipes]